MKVKEESEKVGLKRNIQKTKIMVVWHHLLNGCEFEQTLGAGKGRGSLVCYSPWARKESNRTEQLNNGIHTEKYTCHKRTVDESSQFIISM